MSIVISYKQDHLQISAPKRTVLEKRIWRMPRNGGCGGRNARTAAAIFGKKTPVTEDHRLLRIAATTMLLEVR
jgi:hypothetical protein